ncbi:MAG TPA: polymorphic toxin type 15 domain-containing protein, partial [Allosphingosinicella sp.]|nr:polymorphic toxin type 15 domain-containing protein [Allosphingosinicella sp.]
MATARQPAKNVQAVAPRRPPPARPPPKPAVSHASALQSRIGIVGLAQLAARPAAPRPVPQARAGAPRTPAPSKPGPGTAAGAKAAPPGRTGSGAAPAARAEERKGPPAAGKVQPAAAGPAPGAAPAGPAAATADAAGPAPAAPVRAGPGQSAALVALKGKVAKEAGRQAVAPPAGAAVAEAQAAAVAPGPAGQTRAAEATIAAIAAVPTAEVERAAFKKALKEKLEREMPKPASGADAEKALSSGAAENAGAAMQGELSAQQQQAVGGLPAAVASPVAPGDLAPPAPPPLVPLQPGAAPSIPGSAGAAPPPLPASALDTSADKATSNAQLAGAGVSETQLAAANEPSFNAALASRSAAVEHGATAPALVRSQEAQARGAAESRSAGLMAKGLSGLGALRKGVFGRVGGERSATKTKDEAERQRIASELARIQLATRSEVEKHLATMDSIAKQMLASGLTEALKAFEAERDRLELRAKAKMAEGSFFGSLSMLWSSLDQADLDAAVAGARAAYQRVVDRTIDTVATYVGNVMAIVKASIARGRAAAETFVKNLPEAVRGIGEKALGKISEEFDKLAGEVDSRRDQLIDDLGAQYAEASKKVEESVEAFRQSNKSLWDRAKEAVEGVLKTIEEMKKLLRSIAAKAASVAEKIMDDPIAFLGNLIAGVRKGLDRFTGNFLTHLKAGFFEWLFGQAAEAGIEIPKKFDAAGIFSLIAGVLGLTLANFKARAVQKLGAPFVDALEKGAEIFLVWRSEGFAGLWRMLKEKLEAMKEQALEQIQSMLMTQVIEAGVMWLIGLLNPAAALIKACKAIYEIVMFFVNNGKRILEFVNAVLDSLADIVGGKIDGAAAKVEGALARTIPLAIGFLASLLGLGKISEKVKKIIAKLQAPVNKAIDWLLDKAVSLLKKAGKFLTGKGKDEPQDPAKVAKIDAGLKQLHRSEAQKLRNGRLDAKGAKQVASETKTQHPVFKSLKAVQEGSKWHYRYTASAGKDETGADASDLPKKLDPTAVVAFDAKSFSGDKLIEFKRQLGEQENAINRMFIGKWLKNREVFVNLKRPKGSGSAQKKHRTMTLIGLTETF